MSRTRRTAIRGLDRGSLRPRTHADSSPGRRHRLSFQNPGTKWILLAGVASALGVFGTLLYLVLLR